MTATTSSTPPASSTPTSPTTPRLAVALVHFPCVDRQGETYATSVTNLDVHDVARACRTFDVATFYVVHAVEAQRDLANAIAGFWEREGAGRNKNPDRTEALRRVVVVPTIEDAIERERTAASEAASTRTKPSEAMSSSGAISSSGAMSGTGTAPWVVSTSARPAPDLVPWKEARARLHDESSTLLLFGTGHGLAQQALDLAQDRLPPIMGEGDYNHLSVRSAIAIALDRLLGDG